MMVTLALYSLLCDSIAGMLYPRSTLQWDVLRILVGLVLFFLLYLFWRRYLLEMLDAGQINWTEMSLIPFMLWVCMFTVYLPKTFAEDTMPAPFTLIYVAAVGAHLRHAVPVSAGHLRGGGVPQVRGAAPVGDTVFRAGDPPRQNRGGEHQILRHDLRHSPGSFRALWTGGIWTPPGR